MADEQEKTQADTSAEPVQAAEPAPAQQAPVETQPPAAASALSVAQEAEELCAGLERFFRRAFGDLPKSSDVTEIHAQQAAIRDLVKRAAGSAKAEPAPTKALEAECAKLKDAAARARADFLNYQARTAKDLERAEEQALRSYIADLLPVLDGMDLAQKDAAGEVADPVRLKQALDMLVASLRQVLTVRGLQRIEAAGKPFDALIHEAVVMCPADASQGEQPGMVREELRAGYLWKGLLLRPAQVLVTEPEKKTN